MAFPSKRTPIAAETADRGNEASFRDHAGASETARSRQLSETLSVTIRRRLEAELPVWVLIRHSAGASIKIRPGNETTLAEFDSILRQAKLLLTRGVQ